MNKADFRTAFTHIMILCRDSMAIKLVCRYAIANEWYECSLKWCYVIQVFVLFVVDAVNIVFSDIYLYRCLIIHFGKSSCWWHVRLVNEWLLLQVKLSTWKKQSGVHLFRPESWFIWLMVIAGEIGDCVYKIWKGEIWLAGTLCKCSYCINGELLDRRRMMALLYVYAPRYQGPGHANGPAFLYLENSCSYEELAPGGCRYVGHDYIGRYVKEPKPFRHSWSTLRIWFYCCLGDNRESGSIY